jgi:molybdenum cofactor guanylyltransferase
VTKGIVAGIFVGGRSRRMGGNPKGLLVAPDGGTILARTIALVREVADEVVLVGTNAAYASFDLPVLTDAAPDAGPLGALVALLDYAGERRAIAIACDMPRITAELLARLAGEHDDAAIVAPRDGPRWSPLFARYDAPRALADARARLVAGVHSLQPLLDAMNARELVLNGEERRGLLDWDAPEDIDRS